MSPRTFDITGPLPTGTTVLEASAGTGKTWTIGALVTRYVAEGVAALEEMLVVTFGRAASQELRERVREQLAAAERALADPGAVRPGDDPVVDLLLHADPAEVAARHRRLREAVGSFDAATIATTHQFCQLVLSSLGVAGDSDPTARLVEDLDDLLVEVVDDTYLRGFSRGPGGPVFDRATALGLARTVVGDPQARIEPSGIDPRSDAGRRVGFARLVRTELDRRKRRLGLLSYDDLLSQLADALADEDSPARARMRRRWRVVLVDEFQDTDPVQWQVLRRAFHGHASMVLVGDPKQAIYAFRGGDVVTYLEAARCATDRQTLGTCFRTDGPLVRSLQTVLAGAQLGDEQIVVHPVSARHETSRLAGAPVGAPWRLRVLTRPQLKETGARTARVSAIRPRVARDVAHDIRRLLTSGATFDGRPLRPADVAVLAHQTKHLELVQRELRRIGVAAVVAGAGSVLTSPAAGHWLTVLQAMERPHRSGLVRAAALTPLVGLDAAGLDAGGDALTDELAARMRRWAELLRLRGPAAVLEAATGLGLAQRVLGVEGGERLLTDLRHVAEVLHEVVLRDDLGLVALVSWLREQLDDTTPRARSARARRLDSDAAAVQLVTIHGSKGLQYPVVYAPFLTDRWVPDLSQGIPLYHGGPGHERSLDVSGDPSAEVVRQATEEEDGESLRLLYVALTRAQSQVVTWWAPGTTTDRSALHRVLLGRTPGQGAVPSRKQVGSDDEVRAYLSRWQQEGGPVWEDADDLPDSPAPEPPPRPALSARAFTADVDVEWRRTSYTALTAAAEGTATSGVAGSAATAAQDSGSEPEVPVKDDEPAGVGQGLTRPVAEDTREDADADARLLSPMDSLPVGATFGSLVHAVLEHADPQAPDLRAEIARHVREQVLQWPVELEQGVLVDALVQVCRSPLGPLAPGLTLADVGLRDRLCEMEFEMPLAGGDDPHRDVRLGELAPLLRAHLPEGDPLLPYAAELDRPELGGQSLRGYLTGSIDVVLRAGEGYLVADYKTNWLGPADAPLTAAAYGPAGLAAAMGHSSYPLQAILYAVVLHRYLRWRLRDYDPDRHLGGVLYLYVRGMVGPDAPVVDGHPSGVFSWRPPAALVTAISDLLDGAGAQQQVVR